VAVPAGSATAGGGGAAAAGGGGAAEGELAPHPTLVHIHHIYVVVLKGSR